MTGAGPGDHGAVAPAPDRATPPERPISLRPARAEDAAALARVDAATSTQPWTDATFRAELEHPERVYVVAGAGADDDDAAAGDEAPNRDGEVVGYAGLAFLAGDAHVMGIAVLPSAQGRGVGRLLLTAVCRAAAEADAAMTLEVRPSNEVARHLYRSVGFIEAGRRPGYYPDGEDALILWRHVADTAEAATSAPPATGAPPATPATPTTDGG